MSTRPIEPQGWPRPRGYSNGVLAERVQDLLFVAGQIGWDTEGRLVPGGFAAQFRQALANVRAVLDAGGAAARDLVRLTVYVTDKRQYLAATAEIGAAYREFLGKHYPAMSLVQVADLLEDGALVEIEATAVVRAHPES
jgi:enamine deaminase RidA (YjgF/YER057c/UK114 family)